MVKVNYNSLGLPKLMCPANWNSGAGAYYCIRSEANKSQSPDAWYVSDAGYDVAGRLTRMQYPAGGNLWRTQSYYSWRDPQNPTAVYPNGGLLNEVKVGTDWSHSTNSKNRFYRQYTYNSFGDVLTDGSGYTFTYDTLGRLTAAYGKSYSYWPTNRINTFEGRSFGYNNSHPYHAVKSDNSGYSYLYDANGNLTSVEVSGITVLASYVWNSENRLSSAVKNGVSENYAYDADGNRIRKTSGGVTTRTFFPGVYEEENGVAIKHYSFNGMPIAVRRGGVLSYVHADHLGSSSVETNSSGTQSASRTYYAYGSTRSSSGTLQTDRTFTGQKQDGTGLLYYNARYYDSTLGIFLSPDTLVPDAGRVVDYNRFLYVRGNPLRYSDPTGHLSEDEIRNYYGYEGDDRDALRQAMLDDGWNENLANWLLNPDTHFGDVFTYFDGAGQRVGEAMLALFETGERQFRGGFYGLTGRGAGVEVGRQEVHSFNDDTPLSITLKEKYAGGYTDLPKRTGSDYRNYYDPATYRNYGTGSWAGAGASGVGTAYTVKTCSTPWSCAVGVILSALALVLAPPQSTNYPIILQPDRGGIGNPPSIPSLKPPQGAYQH